MLVNEDIYTQLTADKIPAIVEAYRARLTSGNGNGNAPVLQAPNAPMGARNELTFSTIQAGEGLKKALAMPRVDIIDMVRDAKLKGRGGAGFPTGIKWNFAAAEKRGPKYIMCNADEGEPGTFKDRLILGEYADLVMEGMTIGARAIGLAWAHLPTSRVRLPALPSGGGHPQAQTRRSPRLQRRWGRRLQLQHHGGHGRRRLCLRRRDGPHRVA